MIEKASKPEMNCWKPWVEPNGLPNSLKEKSGLKGMENPEKQRQATSS
jgi:hypothetical protein